MMSKYRVGVLIGRFQPFHNGHLQLLQRAFEYADSILILCGSSNTPRTLKNPFTFLEREAMMRACLTKSENEQVWFAPIDDYPYDDATWQLGVQICVNQVLLAHHLPLSTEIALIGHKKDSSSYYLDLFSNWAWVEVENFDGISATPIRNHYWRLVEDTPIDFPELPSAVIQALDDFRKTPAYAKLRDERLYLDGEIEAWADSPYPPIFTTVDALVVHRGDVLLIERGNHPGKGLLAMPGGFIEENEQIFTSCLRELEEETGIAANAALWQAFLQTEKVYSNPGRSPRGRIITHVFYFRLPDDAPRILVSAGDDAAHAFWQPLARLNPCDFHDDHFHIIRELTALR